jgi:diaminohydroxyphosphoribosylaminopyrimidine deaminase/5-amino-6-(5-phosphoribosylamino)uracil reductase
MASSRDDLVGMARAMRLARNGLYTTDPNPRVGCVLTKAGRVVGEGFHYRAGQPHAERMALAAAGRAAEGATAYVSLEPCCHHGRTPPCTDGLLEAGVGCVVAAMQDPNPLVAGQGLARLAAAGVEVRVGVLEREARALNPGFVKRMESGLPYVRCKLAMSLDGRTAMANGESQWITSPQARQDVQRLRARSSAVVTGIGTVLADDPSLNVRVGAAQLFGVRSDDDVRQPVRVVADSDLRMPATARMLGLKGETWVIGSADAGAEDSALIGHGARVFRVPRGKTGGVDLVAVLRLLAERGINEVLVEAGATLSGAFLAAGLVDELVVYMAPHVMGDGALGLFHLPAIKGMKDRLELKIREVRAVGRDWRIRATPLTARQTT